MAADSNFLRNLGVLGQTPLVPSKRGPVRPVQPDPDFMQNIGAFGSPSASKPAATAPADQSFMQNLGAFSSSPRAEDPMAVMMREAGRTDVNRGLLDDGSFGFKDVYGRPLVNGKVQKTPERQILPQETTKENVNGVVQTGKDLSGGVSAAFVPEYANSSFNDLLAAQGTSEYNAFSSNQLPTTRTNPFERTSPKTQAFNPLAPGITGATYDNYGADGGAAAASSTDKSQFTPMSGKEERIEGASERPKGGRLDAALADKAGINSYMEKFSSGDRERAAGMAFLNAPDSLTGLQRRDAVNDVVYAGGQHYIRDGEGKQAIDRADARQISSGQAKAQDFLKKKAADVTAAVKQSPTLLEDGAKDGAFQQDKPMFSGDTPAIGGAVDFDNNNDQTLPTFSAPKGYKPQSTYKDPAFPNPFG